jgi:recombination protein RecA
MAKSKSKLEIEDALASTLAESINKQFKGQALKTAFFLDGDEDAPSNVTEWVSSGCSMLDLAISNRAHGGFPVGRITEITGLEASGKSLLAAHTLAETQKKGGLAVYIDTEAAVSSEFLTAIGVDLKTMLYVPLETIEEIFETIETIVEGVRKSDKNRLVTIVVDSIMGASTKIEIHYIIKGNAKSYQLDCKRTYLSYIYQSITYQNGRIIRRPMDNSRR